jgi:PAS domain S-box-containing protein
MFRQLLRRFVLPQLVIIVALAAAVAWVSAVQLGHATKDETELTGRLVAVLLVALIATIAAAVATTFAAYRFAVSHVDDIAHLFATAIPSATAAARKKAGPWEHDRESSLRDVARSFSELMDLATQEQAQLRTIIGSMSDGVVATDHEQRILLVNDAAREMLMFRTPSGLRRQLWEVIPLERVLKAVTEVSLTGQQKKVSVGPVNGKWLEVTVTRLPLRPAGFIIVAHDVTEAMRYEELRKEFVANVSHELRTPLSVIKGYVETLQDGALDDRARAAQYLDTVSRHTENLTSLVDDLLSLSRLDSTSAVPSPRPVHLGKVAQKVSELMTARAHKMGHKLVLQIADGLPAVIGNPEYLERALSNLVENAIKYTTREGGGLIRTVVRRDNGQVIVEVIDNGVGIAKDDLPRIFERFYRVDRSRSRDAGGTGLGLSIVKHIVQAHGGQIEVVSTPGEGSTFRMRFPASGEENGASEQAPDAKPTSA